MSVPEKLSCIFKYPSGDICGLVHQVDKETKLCPAHYRQLMGRSLENPNLLDPLKQYKSTYNENIYARKASLTFKTLLEEVHSNEHNGHLDLRSELEVMRVVAKQITEVYDTVNLNPDKLIEKYVTLGLSKEDAEKRVLEFKTKTYKLISDAIRRVAEMTEKCARVYVLRESLPKTNITNLTVSLLNILQLKIVERCNNVQAGLGDSIMKEVNEAFNKVSLQGMDEKKATIQINL